MSWIMKTARTMAHIHTDAGVFSVPYKTGAEKAVAAKMAVADDLLKALKRAANRLHKIKASGISDESMTLPIIEAAIAKAEGK